MAFQCSPSTVCCSLQVSALKRLAFARKQRAIRDAVRIGDQIIRRNRRMLLASTFNAWKVRTGVYRQVARRFQAALQVTLRWAWGQWRAQIATQVANTFLPCLESQSEVQNNNRLTSGKVFISTSPSQCLQLCEFFHCTSVTCTSQVCCKACISMTCTQD